MVRLCIGLARRLLSAPVPVRALSALAVLCACSGVIEWFSLRTLPHSTTRLCVIDASLRGNKGADAWLFLDLSTRSIAEIDLDLNGDRLVDRIIFVPTARLIYTLVDRTFDGRFDVQIEERHAGEQTQWIEKDLASAEYEVDGSQHLIGRLPNGEITLAPVTHPGRQGISKRSRIWACRWERGRSGVL